MIRLLFILFVVASPWRALAQTAESVRKWLPEIQEDFATRADWMLP